MIRPALAAAILLMALPAAAEDACDSSDIIEATGCVQDRYKAADRALNATWKKVMANHPSGGDRDAHKADIRAAQRAWIAFRDADCAAMSQIGIPKYWEFNRFACLTDHTRTRTEALQRTYVD